MCGRGGDIRFTGNLHCFFVAKEIEPESSLELKFPPVIATDKVAQKYCSAVCENRNLITLPSVYSETYQRMQKKKSRSKTNFNVYLRIY